MHASATDQHKAIEDAHAEYLDRLTNAWKDGRLRTVVVADAASLDPIGKAADRAAISNACTPLPPRSPVRLFRPQTTIRSMSSIAKEQRRNARQPQYQLSEREKR